jgi:anti-sigma factor RsiW
MPHLDADVAAFVDGQLSPEATEAAARHVQECARCREAVQVQRQVKRRMQLQGDVRPPASLLASLSSVPQAAAPRRPSLWERVTRSHLWGAAGVLVGASLAVAFTAYLAGGPSRGPGDAVVPPVEAYAAEFDAPPGVGAATTASAVLSPSRMEDLTANGWPCHGRLGADLRRVEGRLQDEGAVTLTYTDGVSRLVLHEQNGVLDAEALPGFEPARVADRPVWLKAYPDRRVVTWDAEGVVYTVVTDVEDERLVAALRDLPAPAERPGLRERMGDGITRVAAWISA